MKTIFPDSMLDNHIGEKVTSKKDAFESKRRIESPDSAIETAYLLSTTKNKQRLLESIQQAERKITRKYKLN